MEDIDTRLELCTSLGFITFAIFKANRFSISDTPIYRTYLKQEPASLIFNTSSKSFLWTLSWQATRIP